MKNIIILNCFPSMENNRVIPALEYFEQKKDNVTLLTTNFHHYSKKEYKMERKNVIQFKVPKYKKNISVSRIFSHFIYAYKSYKYIIDSNVDIIYAKIPPNIILFFLKKIKKKKVVYIIGDVYDLWPESFPKLNRNQFPYKFIFRFWKKIRSNNMDCIDFYIYECNLYRSFVPPKKNNKTIYLCRDVINISDKFKTNNKNNNNVLKILYLGTVGMLLDMELLFAFIKKISKNKSIEFHIIGDGNNKQYLVNQLSNLNCKCYDHGIIFDLKKKKEIMVDMDFGLNFMKEDLLIGLSNKSIDYLQFGIPILNTVGSDTSKIISTYNAGLNINYKNLEQSVCKLIEIMDSNKIGEFKNNAIEAFKDNFTKDIFMKNFNEVYEVYERVNEI